ncbi:hypothetical protein [Arsenophonus nasoniae]|uniref:Uncharacterized protein n=1 Tax=Arsenophonus nasoniae TaxID=638 RepID=A0AA95K891_9GAMM|nr:hypothetical protein [Arsenophonus nasoniae]WGM04115.1 hypothetical protein QE210_21905 [Arsenophonus nasoniae]
MATANASTSNFDMDMIESALSKIEYADSIAVMLLNQSNFDKKDEIVLSALLELINETKNNLTQFFYENDCNRLCNKAFVKIDS